MPIIKVKGMSCQHCAASVSKALGKIEGVSDVQINLESGEVKYSETTAVKPEDISRAIVDAGYEVG